MTDPSWQKVGRVLLGRWPAQVSTWGEAGIQGYVEEIVADGLTPEQAIVALRSYRPPDGRDFPPSVPQVSKLARSDPDRPTLEELMQGLYGPGGLFGFCRSNVIVSPWVAAFADDFGRDELRLLPIDDPDEGKWARKHVAEAWQRFCEVTEGRAVAEIAGRRKSGLARVDVLELARRRAAQPQIERGE